MSFDTAPKSILPDLSLDSDVFPAGMGYDPCPRISAMLASGTGGFLDKDVFPHAPGAAVTSGRPMRSKPNLRLVR